MEKTRNEKRANMLNSKRSLEEFRVIDLTDNQDADGEYVYFLAQMQGKYMVDPFQELTIADSESDAADKDSQDSNRESAE